jgi:UDP-sugar transporter A1/2/3
MLKRRLALHQWIALLVLGFGVGTMQLGTTKPKSDASLLGEPAQMDHLLGFSSVLISCVASAIAATYFELVIKNQPTSGSHSDYSHVPMSPRERQPVGLWQRNVQLSLFSIIVGAIVVVNQGLNGDAEMLTNGFFSGFNALTWVVIGLQATGGLVTGKLSPRILLLSVLTP